MNIRDIRFTKILCPNCRIATEPVDWEEDDNFRYEILADPFKTLVNRYLNPAIVCPRCGSTQRLLDMEAVV